jgi:small-conductance mechanosensitive channel
VALIIPNSIITTNKVINWSHQVAKNRFRINVGVAYGSDIDLVIELLEQSANAHDDVTDTKTTEARLMDFGSSSLDFQILFFSENVFRISKVKSDIRRIISKKFAEHNVGIPFPQLDLHVKSNQADKLK